MAVYPKSATTLIEQLSKLPGVGIKTAQRLAFFILKSDSEEIRHLSEAIVNIKRKIIFCDCCGIMTEESICDICIDTDREDSIICVVEEPQDIYAFEKTNSFHGRYHVLGGVLSPLDGIGPEDLNLQNLYKRVKVGMEIVLATNPSIEGDTTSLYLAKMLENLGAKVTRLARGLPVGSDLEYMDELTLVRAMEGRTIV
ncbi:MAG: recombination mediator RecR [Candidatus Neomarinimicrobiota bacterium]|nr:recombination mediator RecR [Candidatus Neomarinimicrobiota bacterium]